METKLPLGHRREPVHEPPIEWDYGFDLGLLEHHFRDPDAIGRGLELPRQAVSAVAVEPFEQRAGEAHVI